MEVFYMTCKHTVEDPSIGGEIMPASGADFGSAHFNIKNRGIDHCMSCIMWRFYLLTISDGRVQSKFHVYSYCIPNETPSSNTKCTAGAPTLH
jgi:hypothetical protein